MSKNPTSVFPEKRKGVLEGRPVAAEGELLIQTDRALIGAGTGLTVMAGNCPPGSYRKKACAMSRSFLLLCAALVFPSVSSGQGAGPSGVPLPAIFSDNMVLQRDVPVPVWGKSIPAESISVKFKGQEKSVVADANGQWKVYLDPMPVSAEPSTLSVTSSSGQSEFHNVLVGEVWLCSGQSNMQATPKSLGVPDEIQDADNPQIRLFTASRNGGGKWAPCTTGAARLFSAAGYYFALNLWRHLQVPVGVINASEGSSSIETWMPPDSILANDFLVDQNGCKLVDEMKSFEEFYSKYDKLSAEEKNRVFLKHSTGNYVFARSFLKPDGTLKPGLDASILFHMTVIKPAFYFNKFIAQIAPYAIKGVLWYQGETNALTTGDPQYARKQKILIEGWRKLWNEGDFPFYLVQIPPCASYELLTDFWLQQYLAVQMTPRTGLIPTADIGALDNSHPKNKRDVGLRLALLALNDAYGKKDVVAFGPVYKSFKANGATVEVTFDNAEGLSTKDGQPPNWFEVAAADGKFKKAPAVIKGNQVVINSPLEDTKHVRFAWSYLAGPNLINKEGLPPFPFDTTEAFFQKPSTVGMPVP